MGLIDFFQLLRYGLRPYYSRKRVLRVREKAFRKLLHYAWDHSPFYQKHYQSSGIQRKDLATIPIEKIPFTNKKILMDNLDQVYTDPNLRKEEIERWLEQNRNPQDLYKERYVALHTSGTSGTVSVVLYDYAVWKVVMMVYGLRAKVKIFPKKPIRTSCIMAIDGHYTGITFLKTMPKRVYDVEPISILEPLDQIVEKLNAFQPEHLYVYPAILGSLATKVEEGKLNIPLKFMGVSGELCTDATFEQVKKVWGIPVHNGYISTECLAAAVSRNPEEGFEVNDDLCYLELLDTEKGEVKEIVTTNLFNYVTPIIRYQMNDFAQIFPESEKRDLKGPFSRFYKLLGRENKALPVFTNEKKKDSIHSIILAEFFIPGLEQIQFISERIDQVEILYVANSDLSEKISARFTEILREKQAEMGTQFRIRRVEHIEKEPHGKLQFLKILHEDATS